MSPSGVMSFTGHLLPYMETCPRRIIDAQTTNNKTHGRCYRPVAKVTCRSDSAIVVHLCTFINNLFMYEFIIHIFACSDTKM